MGRWYAGETEQATESEEAEAVAQRLGEPGAIAMIRMDRALQALARTGDIQSFDRFAQWYLDHCL